MICDNCFKQRFWSRTGRRVRSGTEMKCRCGHVQIERAQGIYPRPSVLVYDIETSKAIYGAYPSTRPQFLRGDQVIAPPYVLGWAAKWLTQKKVYSSYVTPEEAKNRDEERVVKDLHKMLTKADFVITYNGKKFDDKEMTSRFIKYGLLPTTYQDIDLLQKVKQVCRLPAYSLRYVLDYYGLTPKGTRVDTDLAEKGDAKALRHDEKYCKQDVLSQEELYYILRPHMRTHPSFSVMLEYYQPLEDDERYCPRCTGVIGEMLFSKSHRMPSGNVHRAANCPHCNAIVWKSSKAHFPMQAK